MDVVRVLGHVVEGAEGVEGDHPVGDLAEGLRHDGDADEVAAPALGRVVALDLRLDPAVDDPGGVDLELDEVDVRGLRLGDGVGARRLVDGEAG